MSKDPTTAQLLSRIRKTDQVITDFKKACYKLIRHEDGSNSMELSLLKVEVKELTLLQEDN